MTPARLEKLKIVAQNRQRDVHIVLENVCDLHNVGAVMRTCDAVGIPEVRLVLDENFKRTKKRIGKKTSSGARKWVDAFEYETIASSLREFKNQDYQILGTALTDEAVSMYEVDFSKPTVIVFGNEKKGLSQEAKDLIDQAIIIPQKGLVQSLNISVACAVTLYELCRQRKVAGLYGRNLDDEQTQSFLEKYIAREDMRHDGLIELKE